jgi:molecular chaperone GrpE (heat shock protein)
MTAEEATLLRTLEARVSQIVLDRQALIERNIALRQELEKKTQQISELQAQTARLQADYANLKIARMMDISDSDVKDAKSRIAKLVREVDKCIALLNV